MTAVSVRRAGPGDWATLRQVRLAALADSPAAFASTAASEAALDEAEWRRRASASSWFLAWLDREPVGLAAAYAEQPADGSPAGWHLISMWVTPRMRGAGAADLLAAAVIEHARGQGAAMLTLWVADGNHRARRFYQRLGFRLTGVTQRYLRRDGTPLDEAELVLDLGREPGQPREVT